MSKRVSIITWLGNGNFGTALQSFALHQVLANLGYEVSVLMSCNTRWSLKSIVRYAFQIAGISGWRQRRRIGRTLAGKKLNLFHKEKYNRMHVHLPFQYKRLLRTTDVFVTGSDQIWNAYFNFNPYFFLNFAQDKKRIAYASSIGTTDFPLEHKAAIKALLSKFAHIGVREQTAVAAVSSLLQRNDVVQVLDPTFLFTSSDWQQVSNEAVLEFPLPSNYMLCYLIGNNDFYASQVADVKAQYGIENVIIVPAVENPSFSVDGGMVYADAGPREFIHLIMNAALVCTDSFHATAVSINCSKNFVEFLRFKDTDKQSQNSRIHDVLSHYGLSHRLYSSASTRWAEPIDYASAQSILAADRERSFQYLTSAIES